jgi:uncharacterized phage-associated protein
VRVKCAWVWILTVLAPNVGVMSKSLPPFLVADFLLVESRERGEVLTNLKLQKLLYYAQSWYLALHGESLFDEDFEAWVNGPVLPSQYDRFRAFQWRPITDEITRPTFADPAIETHLREIINVFGSETAISLELMTHRETPWVEARGSLPPWTPSAEIISKGRMLDFYRSLGAN